MDKDKLLIGDYYSMLFEDFEWGNWQGKNHWTRWKDYFTHADNRDARDYVIEIVNDISPVTLNEFINHPRLRPNRRDGNVYGLLTMYFYAAMTVKNGWVYKVQPALAYLLAKTTLKNVKSHMLQVPYPVMFIEIPKQANLWTHYYQTGWHRIEGAYIVEERNTEHFGRVFRVHAIGKSKNPKNPLDDATTVYFISLDSEDLEESIRVSRDQLVEKTHPDDKMHHKKTMPELFRFLMNTLLYITSTSVDIVEAFNPQYKKLKERMLKTKNKQKRRRLNKQLNTSDPEKVRILGSNLVIEGKVPLGEREEGKASNEDTRQVSVRTWVSGHWQGYWTGPRERQKKVIKWKQPFLRGPDMAELINRRTVIVREPKV